MAFAQLTWREVLRDVEGTPVANRRKLYAMGLRHEARRSTLADANESRDWRIWSDLAALLIRRARKLNVDCVDCFQRCRRPCLLLPPTLRHGRSTMCSTFVRFVVMHFPLRLVQDYQPYRAPSL